MKVPENDLLLLKKFLLTESLIEFFAVLLWILVTMLLWKDYLLGNTLN